MRHHLLTWLALKIARKREKILTQWGRGNVKKLRKLLFCGSVCMQECYPLEINILKSELLKLKIVPEHALEPYYPDLLLQLRTTAAYLSKS